MFTAHITPFESSNSVEHLRPSRTRDSRHSHRRIRTLAVTSISGPSRRPSFTSPSSAAWGAANEAPSLPRSIAHALERRRPDTPERSSEQATDARQCTSPVLWPLLRAAVSLLPPPSSSSLAMPLPLQRLRGQPQAQGRSIALPSCSRGFASQCDAGYTHVRTLRKPLDASTRRRSFCDVSVSRCGARPLYPDRLRCRAR